MSVSVAQDIPYCGPEKETCVANVTLKDKACLISCDGLYADIEDISLKQSVMEGSHIFFAFFKTLLSGFLKLSQGNQRLQDLLAATGYFVAQGKS